MEVARLSELKPRTVWEITDDAFDLYRENFALLASISAVIFVPVGILWVTAAVPAFLNLVRSFDGPDTLVESLGTMGWIIPLLFVGYLFHFGATAVAVQDILLGEKPTFVEVYKRTFSRFGSLFFGALGAAVIAFVSLCIWIGPALVAAYFCFTSHGILLENRKLGAAWKRSIDMANAYFGKSFGLVCLMTLLTLALVAGFQGIIQLGFFLFPDADGASGVFELQRAKALADAASQAVIVLIITPLPAIATTLLYYDLRVRREGLDLEFEAEQWGIPLAPDAFGGVLNPKIPKEKKGRG